MTQVRGEGSLMSTWCRDGGEEVVTKSTPRRQSPSDFFLRGCGWITKKGFEDSSEVLHFGE